MANVTLIAEGKTGHYTCLPTGLLDLVLTACDTSFDLSF